MELLLVSCSAFTVTSSLPPCSQKTWKDLLSPPALLPLFSQMLLRNGCAIGLKGGKIAFTVSGPQQYKHGSVGVKQRGDQPAESILPTAGCCHLSLEAPLRDYPVCFF